MTDMQIPGDLNDLTAPRRRRGGTGQLVALTIAVLTALVFASAYIAGRYARPAGGDAQAPQAKRAAARETAPSAPSRTAPPAARRSTAPDPVAAGPSATLGAALSSAAERGPAAPAAGDSPVAAPPAGYAGPFADFDLGLLVPEVADAVAKARAVQVKAVANADRGREAAESARAQAPGTKVIESDNGNVYAGQVSDDGAPVGFGVLTWAKESNEDEFSGEFIAGTLRLGVIRWKDGVTIYGDRRLDEGYGVFVSADGSGYEGGWSGSGPKGYGVAWKADGSLRGQGVWQGNQLLEPMLLGGEPSPPAN